MPIKRKDIVNKRADALKISLAKIARALGYNNRESLYQQFKKDDIDIELYNKIKEYLDSLEKGIIIDESITQNQSGGDSSMQFAGHRNKGKVQEVNHFKCAYNVAELSKLVNDGIDRAMQGYKDLLAEKDARIKDLKEVIELLKHKK